MNRLFITDLDGTALGGNYPVYARFPECFASMLDELAGRGWSWAVNTTWDVEGQWKLVRESPVKSRPAYLIGEFGRRIARIRDEKLELLQPYCAQNDERVKDLASRKIIPLMEKLNRCFHPEKIHFFGHLFQYIALEESGIEAFAEEFRGDPELIVSAAGNQIVVRPAFLDKGNPVREIMRIEGLAPENVVAAGDETVDLSMMTPDLTRHPLCPANAAEAVRTFVRNAGGTVAKQPFGAGVSAEMRLHFLEKKGIVSAR